MVNNAYRDQRLLGWTRIDMLLALYEAALLKLQQADQALSEGSTVTARQRGLEALRIVGQLNAGIASQYGDLSENMTRLCNYASQRILGGDQSGIHDAHRVLAKLHEAFAEIQDEAVALEMRGIIPPLEEIRSCDWQA